MTTRKVKGLLDQDGDEFIFIPPAPEGDNLGGISSDDVTQIGANASNIESLSSSLNKLDSNNMFEPTLTSSTTVNGIALQHKGYRYIASGTATADAWFKLGTIDLKSNRTYRFVGCPQGGSTTTYGIGLVDEDDAITFEYETGEGKTYQNSSNHTFAYVYIYIRKGITVSNLEFKPMVTRNTNATYDDFKQFYASYIYGETLNNALNEQYSTTETLTNKTWIDGKPIYRKVVEYTHSGTIGAVGKQTEITIEHGISNLKKVVNVKALHSSNTTSFQDYVLPTGGGSTSVSAITLVSSLTNAHIVLRIVNDTWTNKTWHFIIEYTKN